MKVNTIPGASYALTCTAACTIHALLSDASSLVVLETENPGQYFFIAPTDTVEVSDEHALVTQTFKAAAPGLSARGGIRPGVNEQSSQKAVRPWFFEPLRGAGDGTSPPDHCLTRTGCGSPSHSFLKLLRGSLFEK